MAAASTLVRTRMHQKTMDEASLDVEGDALLVTKSLIPKFASTKIHINCLLQHILLSLDMVESKLPRINIRIQCCNPSLRLEISGLMFAPLP